MVDACLCSPGAVRERAFDVGEILRAGAELSFLIFAMWTPKRAVERSAALRDAFSKRIVLVRRWRQILPIYKCAERCANGEYRPNGDADAAQAAFLLFGSTINHSSIVLLFIM